MEDALKKGDDQPPIDTRNNNGNGNSSGGNTPPKPEGVSIINWVKNLLPAKLSDDDALREAIVELIDEKDTKPTSAVAAHERRLITNILELRDLPVVDMMIPRADIVSIDIKTSREALMQLLTEKPHTRLPVYKDDLDNIVGVINLKDLISYLASGSDFEIRDLMRDAMVVSPAMRVMDLILQMRQSKVHIAFVIDEFGGIDGLITINDLIEAIVGEIDDEYDFEIQPQLIERPDGSAIADARFPIEAFEARYGNLFSEDEENEEVDTLGGLVTYIAGHVPTRGEVIPHKSGLEFEVIDADPRRITRVRIRNLPKKDTPTSAD